MRLEIRTLQRRLGIKSVYVTHDQEEAMVVADRIVLMKDGRIEQIGTPQEIYDRPNSVFAAEFIGSANVIRGAVEGHGPEGSRIALAPGIVIDAPAIDAPVSTPVDVVIRPEHFGVAGIDSAARRTLAHLRGAVTESVFVGAYTEVTVDVGPVKVRAHVIPARAIDIGSTIELAFNVDRIVLLRPSGGPAVGSTQYKVNEMEQA
jgi:ABC-type Fe3+/spermidine/putrescine transport system ATPase subunit